MSKIFKLSDDVEKEIMIKNITILFELIKAEADSIWTYVLRKMHHLFLQQTFVQVSFAML